MDLSMTSLSKFSSCIKSMGNDNNNYKQAYIYIKKVKVVAYCLYAVSFYFILKSIIY